MDVLWGLIAFCFLLYFLVINPIKEYNLNKEIEREREQEKQRKERINAVYELQRNYSRGYDSLKECHPEWETDDFYYHSNEVIAEQQRLYDADKRAEQQRQARLKAEKKLQEQQRREKISKEILNNPLRAKYAYQYYKLLYPSGTLVEGSDDYKIGALLIGRLGVFELWIKEQERINNSPNPEEEKQKIEEEKRIAKEAKLAEIRRKQEESKKKQEDAFNNLKARYPRGVRYATTSKGWTINICLQNQSQIQEFEKQEREKERKRELDEAERRRKQQEKGQALQYMNNAVSNWDMAGAEVRIFSLFYYYPTTCTDVSIDNRKTWVRKFIWKFKDGSGCMAQDLIEKVLMHFFGKDRLKYVTFVCIPASTRIRNELRYQIFSSSICKSMGMEDAFSHINLTENLTPSHLGSNNTSDNFQINRSFFGGKSVIIFDDVTTSGHSMVNMKRKLEAAGAKVICGITLGKTVHTDRGIDPYDLIFNIVNFSR